MIFERCLVNRKTMPTGWMLIVDDHPEWGATMLSELSRVFGPEGRVLFCVAPSAEHAAALLLLLGTQNLLHVFVDHDMPWGNGADLLRYLRTNVLIETSVPITAMSGLKSNNDVLLTLGANNAFRKDDLPDLINYVKELYFGGATALAAPVLP